MNDYKIFVDASCDVNPDLVKEMDVSFIPMSYMVGEEPFTWTGYESDVEIKNFYNKLRDGAVVSTSQVPPQIYMDEFQPYLDKGMDIIYLCLSSGLTGTYAGVTMVCENFKEKYPDRTICAVDTCSATIGIGMMLERLCENKKKGMSVQENADDVKSARDNLFHMFLVEDLMHLKRGGRISAASAVVGTALKICPILSIDDEGKLYVVSKKRGELAIKFLQTEYEEKRNHDNNRVYVVHADAPERAEKLCTLIKEANQGADIEVRTLTPIIGAHTGPDMTAVVCWM